MKILLAMLIVATVAVWAYNIGTLSLALRPVYESPQEYIMKHTVGCDDVVRYDLAGNKACVIKMEDNENIYVIKERKK